MTTIRGKFDQVLAEFAADPRTLARNKTVRAVATLALTLKLITGDSYSPEPVDACGHLYNPAAVAMVGDGAVRQALAEQSQPGQAMPDFSQLSRFNPATDCVA